MTVRNPAGFTLLEFTIAFAITTIATGLVIGLASSQRSVSRSATVVSTQNRIVAGIRDLAGSPAALRTSMIAIAASGSGAANEALMNCAGGPVANSCHSGQISDLILYAPIMVMTNGVPTAVPRAFPPHSSTPVRYDEIGLPCSTGEICPLIVTTQFTPQCGPPPTATLTSVAQLQPAAVCTVADIISVSYSISLDPNMAAQFPMLTSFSTPVTGSVVTSILAITGNQPQ